MSWVKKEIILQDGSEVTAQAPVIISASRSTDIPAFYADWLVSRIRSGYVRWRNPFNGVPLYVSFANARLIVFWSKNPRPLLKHLSFFDEHIPHYYFQYTLNNYEKEGWEPGVPSLQQRIETFQELSERIGREKVIWRFDPLFLAAGFGVDELLKKVESIGDRLKGYTEKLVFSFADIRLYKKVQLNLQRSGVDLREFDEETMIGFARGLQQLNNRWGYQLATCAEPVALEAYGIQHNRCIDDDLIIRLFYRDKALMDFLQMKVTETDLFNGEVKVQKLRNNKDRGQRRFCGCIVSKDIGEYNTCPHQCIYCYANISQETVLKNRQQHQASPDAETIRGI